MIVTAQPDRPFARAENGWRVTAGCNDASMTITIPTGQPNRRFMRYVRPPIKDSDPPLFPLRPATRPLRLGIDITTLPTPPDGYLSRFLTARAHVYVLRSAATVTSTDKYSPIA